MNVIDQPVTTIARKNAAARRYIDLLCRCLVFSMWDDPGTLALDKAYKFGPFKGMFTVPLRLLRKLGIELRLHKAGTFPAMAHTMTTMLHLERTRDMIETVLEDGVEGDFCECGTWRGGCAILMRGMLEAYGDKDRKVWVCDSFEGLPKPKQMLYPEDWLFRCKTMAVPLRTVQENFRRYGLLDDRVKFIKGFFGESLLDAPIHKLAVLRMDGDLYESTMDILTNLYCRLSPGGYCIVDDYILPGCAKAVTDFRALHNITAPLVRFERESRYWRKES